MEVPPGDMHMEGPPGYPPPTLIRRRSRLSRSLTLLLLLLVVIGLGAYALIWSKPTPSSQPMVKPSPPVEVGTADSNAADLPDMTGPPPVTVEAPSDTPVQPSPDARQPNRWYYVPVLGDGPGAIYSRTGGAWNFAFACTARSRTIEILAVGTGDPGDFDKQAISVGKVRLMMDAAYSKDAGGTISTTLPAAHPFFNALGGNDPMEIQLVASRKSVIPVGPDLLRLIRECRGKH